MLKQTNTECEFHKHGIWGAKSQTTVGWELRPIAPSSNFYRNKTPADLSLASSSSSFFLYFLFLFSSLFLKLRILLSEVCIIYLSMCFKSYKPFYGCWRMALVQTSVYSEATSRWHIHCGLKNKFLWERSFTLTEHILTAQHTCRLTARPIGRGRK